MEDIQELIRLRNLRQIARIAQPFLDDKLVKGGGAAQEGEVRTWNGKKMRKQGGKWMPVTEARRTAPESGKKDKSSAPEDSSKTPGAADKGPKKPAEKINVSSHEMGQLKRIKELINKKDYDGANDLAADLGEEAKNVIPAEAWSKMHERTSPTGEAKADVKEKAISADSQERTKKWVDQQKEMFDTGEHAHPDRSKAAKFIRGKVKGFIKGLKHEIEHIKEAGSALKKIFTGKYKEMTHHEKKALKKVGISLGLTLGTMLATGGISAFTHGFSSAATHIGIHFAEHALLETAGLSMMFAKAEESEAIGEEDMDKMLAQLTDLFIDYVENGDWKAAFETGESAKK